MTTVQAKGQLARNWWTYLKAAFGLALGAGVGLDFRLGVLEEGPQHKAALGAVVLDHLQLGEHPGAAGDHPVDADQLVQVEVSA